MSPKMGDLLKAAALRYRHHRVLSTKKYLLHIF